jgi:hypothetical protein
MEVTFFSYFFSVMHQGARAESHETAYKMMMANSYAPFLEYSITPIIDFKVASDSAKEYLKKIAR